MSYQRPYVAARENGKGRYALDVSGSGHTIAVDEPVENGGDDLGLSPMQLLAAALASCTTITLRIFAERKGWPVKVIETRVSHFMTEHEEGLGGAPDRANRVNVFDCKVMIDGDLDEIRRKEMLTVALHCHVHRILSRESRITAELVQVG